MCIRENRQMPFKVGETLTQILRIDQTRIPLLKFYCVKNESLSVLLWKLAVGQEQILCVFFLLPFIPNVWLHLFFLSIWLMQLFFSKIISIFSHIWRSNISLKKFILLRSCHWHTVMHTNAKHVQYVRVNLIFVSIWIMDVQSACRLWFYTFMDNITWHMSDTLCRELGR